MRNIEEYQNTVNSTVYNKSRKTYLATSKGAINCSWCKYHKGENREKYYGGKIADGFERSYGLTYPSWKLASTNRKQWMPKNKVEVKASEGYRGGVYIDYDIRTKGKKYQEDNFKSLWKREVAEM